MSRSYKYSPDEYNDKYDEETSDATDETTDVLFDDSQLSTGDVQISANSDAAGDLSITRQLSNKSFSNQSSKARKRADRELRKQRRHDERL